MNSVAEFRVLVCGGRDFEDWATVQETLDAVHAEHIIDLIIHGGATGADSLGGRWAHENKIPVARYEANWEYIGRSAGPIRNQSMLRFGKPDLVLAFPGGRGTDNMVKQAEAAGVDVRRITDSTT